MKLFDIRKETRDAFTRYSPAGAANTHASHQLPCTLGPSYLSAF